MEKKMEKTEEKKQFSKFLKTQVLIMGLLFTADQFFGFFDIHKDKAI